MIIFLRLCFFILLLSPSLKGMEIILDEESKKPQSFLNTTGTSYFEKMKDMLDILDDDKKRETFFKNAKVTIEKGIVSFEHVKGFVFYSLKLLIVGFLYILLKRGGEKILDYRITILHKRHENIFLKGLNSSKNINMIETFASLFNSAYIWVLRVIFILLFLTTLGINIEPILYSAGFLAFAVSFASQGIIKDLINGIFYVVDGSLAVGEYIQAGNHKGLIEHISLRSLQLRYSTGELVNIPFSSITEVINYSRNYSKIKAEVIICANQDLESVKLAFQNAFDLFKKTHSSAIIDMTLTIGMNKITEQGSHIYAAFKAAPDPTDRMKSYFLICVHNQMLDYQIKRVDGGPTVILSNTLPQPI